MDLLKQQQILPDEFGCDNRNDELSWNTFPSEVDPSKGKNTFIPLLYLSYLQVECLRRREKCGSIFKLNYHKVLILYKLKKNNHILF